MKTGLVVAIVVAVHCVAVGSLLVIQGCGTSRGPVAPAASEQVKMPQPVMPEVKPSIPSSTAPVVETTETKTMIPKTSVYVVEPGDSLSLIAQRFHLTVAEIQTLNNIKDPKKIRIGQKLILPGELDIKATPKPVVKKKVEQPPKVKTEAAAQPTAQGDHYVVAAGDSLSKIAAKFGTKVDAIKNANGLTSNNIKIGQKLVIPAGAPKKESLQQQPAAAPASPAKTETPPPAATPAAAPAPAPAPAAPQVNLDSKPVNTMSASAEPATTGESAAVITHTVLEGDDLKGIAMQYQVSEEDIKKANNMTDSTLKIGQTLNIPMAK